MTENALYKQVLSLPELVREQTWVLEDRMRKQVPTEIQYKIRQIIMTGSGDSAIAGDATKHLMQTLVRVPTFAEPSMEVAHYTLDSYRGETPYTPFVFAVSNSGEVARVVEAARRAQQVGGYVVGLTANPDSRLAEASDVVVDIEAPAYDGAAGMRSYIMALLTLELFAIRFAEVRGEITMDIAQAMRGELAEVGDALEKTIEMVDQPLREFAQKTKDATGVEFLGSGPSNASAQFGAAKVFEAVGKQATAVDVEEFVHMNYFNGNPESTATLLIAPAGAPSHFRANEAARLLNNLGRPWVVLGGDVEDAPSIPLPEVREDFSPLITAAAVGLYAAHLQDATGEVVGRGATGRWADCQDGRTTRESQIFY